MRTLGALLLSLTSAITTFFSVLVVLDGVQLNGLRQPADSRLGQFAMPGLAVAAAVDKLDELRPLPAIFGPAELASGGRGSAITVAAPAAASAGGPVRTALVPPVARRVPKEPPLPSAPPPVEVAATSAEPATPVAAPALPSSTAAASDVRPVPAPRPAVRTAKAPLDTSVRSALGGPRPAGEAKASARKPAVPAKRAPTAAKSEPTPPPVGD